MEIIIFILLIPYMIFAIGYILYHVGLVLSIPFQLFDWFRSKVEDEDGAWFK